MDERGLRVLVAPDSFKEALDAPAVASAIARGVRQVTPRAVVVQRPLSDGGEGFLAAVAGPGHQRHLSRVRDSVGRERAVDWASRGGRAYVEVARVVGLDLVPVQRRDPMSMDTRGVGELLRAVLAHEPREVVIGLGGTGTSDGGAGMLSALGVQFMDEGGAWLEPRPRALGRLARVDIGHLDLRLARTRLVMACDVTAPLTGPHGAAAVFGPQKGVNPAQVRELDRLLGHVAALTEAAFGCSCSEVPGAGAAGGLGWALKVLGAEVRPGFEVVAEATDLASEVAAADLVISGEGSFDSQSLEGKLVQRLGRLCQEIGRPLHVLAGRVEQVAVERFREVGIASVRAITPPGSPRAEALAGTAQNLTLAAARLAREVAGQSHN